MTWRSSGEFEVLSVVARPSEFGTSVSVMIDRRWTFALTVGASSFAVFFAFLAGVGFYDVVPALAPWIPVAGIVGTFAAARGFWASSTKRARERIGRFMDAIGHAVVQPDDRVEDDAPSPVHDAIAVGDAERPGA